MDVEKSKEMEFDIHEVRYLGHSRKIGIKWNSNSKQMDQNDAMEKRDETIKFINETFKMKECVKCIEEPYDNLHKTPRKTCFCGEYTGYHYVDKTATSSDQEPNNAGKKSLFLTAKNIKKLMQRSVLTMSENVYPRFSRRNDTSEEFISVARKVSLKANGTQTEGWTTNSRQSLFQWSSREAIDEMPTDSFGEIEFTGQNSWAKPAKFIRLSNTSSLNNVLKLMIDHWCMDKPVKPSVVISVHGGTKNFQLDQRVMEVFTQGLVKAASATHAWLLTSGFNTGVTKLVGQAVKEGQTLYLSKNRVTHGIRCVGIASWGYVQNRHWLTNVDGQGSWPASYIVDPVNKSHKNKPVPLDRNHTHFLLVDDGYRNTFRTEIAQFRTNLERQISRGGESHSEIPVVVVLVNGGMETPEFAFESLKAGISLIVCEGTGRIADVFAFVFKNIEINAHGIKSLVADKRQESVDKLRRCEPKGKQELTLREVELKLSLIVDCCQFENLVTVFDMNSNEDFDSAILSALFRGCGTRPLDQLRLALKWNRTDVFAEELIAHQLNRDTSELNELLTEALIFDKTDFVKLLFTQGVPAQHYLTVSTLRHLYNATEHESHLRHLLIEVSQANSTLFLCDVGDLLVHLMRHVDEVYSLDEPEALIFQTIAQNQGNKTPEVQDFESAIIDEAHFLYPYKELFLWAILMNRPVLAKFFWTRIDNPVMGALVATKLYSGLLEELSYDKSDLGREYFRQKLKYETLAINIVNEAYEIDSEKAMLIVERPHSLWGDFTCLQMAGFADDKRFMSTTCCQDSVEQIWMRGLKCSVFQVFVATLFPLLILKLNFEKNVLGSNKRSWLEKVKTFYKAPATKFSFSFISHVLFLFLYSFEVLFDLHDRTFSNVEIILHFWVLTIGLGEIEQLVYRSHLFAGQESPKQALILYEFARKSIRKTLRDANFWTKLNSFALLLHAVGFGLRFVEEKSLSNKYTRLVFCLALAVFYFRTFRYYMASSYLGPKLFVIRRMIGHVFMFVSIVVIIMLAYSVAAQALLYPPRSFYWGIFSDIFFYPYWQLYGEVALDETVRGIYRLKAAVLKFENSWLLYLPTLYVCQGILSEIGDISGCQNGSLINSYGQKCRESFWPVTIMLAIYLMFGSILLVNLLIAVFTHVFEQTEKHSTEIWKFEMCGLAVEFDNVSLFPPPLNLPEVLIVFVSWTCCARKPKNLSEMIPISEKQKEHLQIFEKQCTQDCLIAFEASKTSEMGRRVGRIMQK